MLSKLLGSSVVVVGLLLAGPQKASADVVYACVNTTTGLIYIVSATTTCPSSTSGATWIKINWTANAGGTATNVLYTPSIRVNSGNIGACLATNISAQARSIQMQIFNAQGQIVDDFGSVLTPPGGITGGGNNSTNGFFHCKFTVTDGTSSDIRGVMQVCTADGFVCPTGTAVEAQ